MASTQMTSLDYQGEQSSFAARNKRRNTALSCAECRRLKLRCTRTFPCTNCVKKGCAAICPEGSLTTGKGNRFVLANTEVLHDKIGQLSSRVRQLEDALAESHCAISHQTHHLLTEELLSIKRPLERERSDAPTDTRLSVADTDDVSEAIGSLSISQTGRASFFGSAANSWYLLQNEDISDGEEDLPDNNDPADAPWLSQSFPFGTAGRNAEQIRAYIYASLPHYDVARQFSDVYFKHAGWMYTPISELEFQERILRRVYNPVTPLNNEGPESHALAALCMVLAIGITVDLERPPRSAEATHFYNLGRMAMSLDSVFEEQSVIAIQALLLMCHFLFLSDIESNRWVLMGIVTKLTQSIGLHRDSLKWQLSPEETQRRRMVFWEVYTYDTWQSLTFGRPPSFNMAHVDTQMPYHPTKNERGDVEMSFSAWKHRFASQCLSTVLDQAFGARAPSYKTVQEMEKKVRNYYVPPSLQVPGFGASRSSVVDVEPPTVQLTMQRYIAFAIREISVFYMHRGFFARALEDSPEDPMGSKYSPSVLAAYSSACSFVGLIESLYSQHPGLTERMWFLFTHVFSCSIVLGSIATKYRVALAPSALTHLESAYNLFRRLSETSRSAKVLPIIQKLKDRAHVSIGQLPVGTPLEPPSRYSTSPAQVKDEDEFQALGGTTRFVSRKSPTSPASSRSDSYPAPSPPSYQESTPPPQTELVSTLSRESPTAAWQKYDRPLNMNDYSAYNPLQDTTSAHSRSSVSPLYSNFSSYANPETSAQYPAGYENVFPQSNFMHPQIQMQSVTNFLDVQPSIDHTTAWYNFMAQFKPM